MKRESNIVDVSKWKKIAMATAGIIILGAGGYWIYKKLISNAKEQKKFTTEKSTDVNAGSKEPVTVPVKENVYSEENATEDLSTWNEFNDTKLGIQFKYPPTYEIIASKNEFDSYVFTIIDKRSPSDNVKMLIQLEEQDEHISLDDYLQNAIQALSLIGSSVQKMNEKTVFLPGALKAKEVELLTTTKGPTQMVKTWCVITTLPTKSVAVQYVSPDMRNFDTTTMKNIVRSLYVTENEYDVTIRIQATNQNLSITLPSYRYHIHKPYATKETVVNASIISGDLISEMIDITAHTSISPNQFLNNHRTRISSKPSFSSMQDIKTVHGAVPASTFTYVDHVDHIQYRCYDAIFEHHGVSFLVQARCLLERSDNFQKEIFESIKSIAFNEKPQLQEDLTTYTNRTYRFSYEIPAEFFIKQHCVYPIVTFTGPPSAVHKLRSQTQIAVRDIQTPIVNLIMLRQILMSELEQPDTMMEILSEKEVVVANGIPALEIVFKILEPFTQHLLVFFVTSFVQKATSVFSIKSCTLASVYNESVYQEFVKEHSSFKFL